MPNTEGRWRSFISIWAGSPPQKVFDILQRDVSEEAFYDKPSWGDPESDACNAPLSQPACSFSHLFFQLGWGFLLSLCVLHSPFARERERPASTLCSLCKIYGSVWGNIPTVAAKKSQVWEVFRLGTQKQERTVCSMGRLYMDVQSIHKSDRSKTLQATQDRMRTWLRKTTIWKCRKTPLIKCVLVTVVSLTMWWVKLVFSAQYLVSEAATAFSRAD